MNTLQKNPPLASTGPVVGRLFIVTTIALTIAGTAMAQVSLSGTNYTQNFNGIDSGLPPGWSVRTGASASSLGTVATFNTARVGWATTTGQFPNYASTFNENTNVLGSATSGEQSGITNRCPGIRQTAGFGNPGAAFVFQVQNTIGLSNFTFSIDLNMLSVQGHSTTWTIEYAVSNAPTSFTTLGTYSDPGVFGTTTTNFALGPDANNQSENLWIRVVALTASTGSGSRDSFGIDNFSLNYQGPSAVAITDHPDSQTNFVLSTATFVSAAAGAPTLFYQWYKDGVALSDGGPFSGATSDTLTVGPLFHTNAGNYRVIVTNATSSATSSVATLTVAGFVMTAISPTNTLAGTPVTVGVDFIDNQSPINTATGTSANQSVLPDANISENATGNAATATMTPPVGANGVAIVSISATEGGFTTNSTFPLLVVPNTNVVFNDHFDYPDGSVTSGSYGLWRNHSGPAGEMIVSSGELRVSRTFDEDANALLIGQPYATNSGAVLYSRFKVRFTALPTVNGNYFAMFKDASSTGFRARVWASSLNAANTNQFRLGIGNANTSNPGSGQYPQDLDLNTSYTVLTRLIVADGTSTIWINPSAETDASVTAVDAVTNNIDIVSYAFRQDSSEGIMFVDDLVVAKTFTEALGAPSPIPLNIEQIGGDVVLTWAGSAFNLQSSPLANGTYTNIPSATSPHTNPITGSQKFFRLKYP